MEILKDEVATAICGAPVDTAEFMKRLGEAIIRLPIVAKIAGHSNVSSTAKDYVRTNGIEPAEQKLVNAFLIDLFSLNTDQMVEKWYNHRNAEAWAMSNMKGFTGDAPK